MTTTAVDSEVTAPTGPAGLDVEAAYRALVSRDSRFDGTVWFGVTSTGIYCRPVCPAQTPQRRNVRFFADPAAAVSAGFRACRRCRPDAAPGSRHWDHRGDLAARALRLVADGVVDEAGVSGLAERLHVSERHVHRTLVAEVGVGPLQLAISRRAQTARLLVDQTDLPLADVAFAAGFASVRQFNDVMRREFGVAPSALRRTPATSALPADAPALSLRLSWRGEYDVAGVGAFLAARAVPGIEEHTATGGRRPGWEHRRAVPLPHGPATITAAVRPGEGHVVVHVRGADLRDTAAVVSRVRRWLDLDADPAAVADVLAADPWLAPLVAALPGARVCGSADPWEGLARTIVGQQVSVAAARTLLGRVAGTFDQREVAAGLRPFPAADVLAAADVEQLTSLGLTGARARTLIGAARAVATGQVRLGAGADRPAALEALRALPGVGEWTAQYVALRVLGDPDAFPATDLVLRRAGQAHGLEPRALATHAAAHWSPWRAYAATVLWSQPTPTTRSPS